MTSAAIVQTHRVLFRANPVLSDAASWLRSFKKRSFPWRFIRSVNVWLMAMDGKWNNYDGSLLLCADFRNRRGLSDSFGRICSAIVRQPGGQAYQWATADLSWTPRIFQGKYRVVHRKFPPESCQNFSSKISAVLKNWNFKSHFFQNFCHFFQKFKKFYVKWIFSWYNNLKIV